MKLEKGTLVSHYKILSAIGKGGMGEVHLARDTKLDRKVAIKFLSEEFSRDADKLQRFVQEAKAASGLNHPHILTVYEIGEVEDTQYIATEYIDGKTLRDRIEADDLSLVESVKIIEQIADALTAAHEAGIIHRDIKPENIMIRKDGYAKILDFGLAKPIRPEVSEEDATVQLIKTNPGMVMGSVRYMSPEQARGKATDERTDIWSLGVVLYEMVTGRNPFVADNVSDSLVAVVSREPEQIEKYVSGAPAILQEIVTKALQKEADKRYAAMADLGSDIKKLRFDLEHDSAGNQTVRLEVEPGENKTVVREAGLYQTAEDQGGQTNTNISGEQAAASGSRKRKLAAAAALIVAAVILTGFGYGLYQLIKSPKDVQTSQIGDDVKLRRLTGDGQTYGAVISPDGKFLAFRKSRDLWLKQIETNSEVELVKNGEFPGGVGNFAFSPDGNFIYFNGNKPEDKTPAVYRVPTLGGSPVKLLAEAWGVSFSPDGKQIAFRRGDNNTPKTSVHIANADGSNERKLAGFDDSVRFFSSKAVWSPDGQFLAVIVAAEELLPRPYIPAVISVADGAVTYPGKKSFRPIYDIVWRSSGDFLYFSGEDGDSRNGQIWEIGYPSGESRVLARSTNRFGDLSITADGKSIVTTEFESKESLWVSPDTDPKNAKQKLPDNSRIQGFSWTPDGRIVYVSDQSGATEIWIMDQAGENPKQLTNDRRFTFEPDVSPDGRYIVYKRGSVITRINIDGGSPLKLTNGSDDTDAQFSPDSKSVIYTNWLDDGAVISQVPAEGGTIRNLTDFVSRKPRYSPDGKFFACSVMDEKTKRWDRIAIVPAEGGAAVKMLELPAAAGLGSDGPVWTPDGKYITYFDADDNGVGLRLLPVDGGPPKKLEIPENTSMIIRGRKYSRDGKQIAIVLGRSSSNAVLITNFR